ncbi:MAG TPA: hypothetical protein PLW81_13720 [Thiobacillaceae bacterium]|nr:hypothetical protein [Thiobacillaceae bacterium]
MKFAGAVLALLILAGLAGCAAWHPRGETGPLPGFHASAADPRVWVPSGSEVLAGRVSEILDEAIARVEAVHGQPFKSSPVIHVCPDDACFARHVRTPRLTAAVVADNRLILSPRLFAKESWRLPGILRHELSHVHLGQRAGHYSAWIPVWFHEGLATLVADGAGAEFASPFLTEVAWNEGRQIDFAARDNPDRRHRAMAFALNIHQFYLQAWRFVAFLRARDPTAFHAWLIALQEGADFHIALGDAYNTGIKDLAAEYARLHP